MIFTQEAPLTRKWLSVRSSIRPNWNWEMLIFETDSGFVFNQGLQTFNNGLLLSSVFSCLDTMMKHAKHECLK